MPHFLTGLLLDNSKLSINNVLPLCLIALFCFSDPTPYKETKHTSVLHTNKTNMRHNDHAKKEIRLIYNTEKIIPKSVSGLFHAVFLAIRQSY